MAQDKFGLRNEKNACVEMTPGNHSKRLLFKNQLVRPEFQFFCLDFGEKYLNSPKVKILVQNFRTN